MGKTDAVAMRREVLEVSWQRIRVDYEFVNESGREVTLPVVFPLPLYGPAGPSYAWTGQPSPTFAIQMKIERF